VNSGKRFRRLLGASVLVGALVVTGTVFDASYAAPTYPTWAEVQAAKRSVAKKKALIARFNAILQGQMDQEDKLSNAALALGEKYNQAKEALNVVAANVATLQAQADTANAQAVAARTRLAQIASQMYRSGNSGGNLSMFLNSGAADNLLYQLGAQDRLAKQNDTTYKKSVAKQRYAQSVTDQLAVAKKDLATKAKAAKDTFAQAQSAADALTAKINANKALQTTFYAQLASLMKTSAALERRRAEGIAWEKRQSAGSQSNLYDAPELYSVQDADPAIVSRVLSFARAQIGDAYVFGAAGMTYWDCSGLTMRAYSSVGIYIGWHSAVAQFNVLSQKHLLVPIKDRQPGDLLFYSTSDSFSSTKYHTAIYSGGNMMIEAPRPGAFVREVPMRWGELFPYAARPSA